MITKQWFLATVMCAVPAFLGSTGCLKRTERIRISADGTVKIGIVYEGEKADFETLDALPSSTGGWKVDRQIKVENNKEIVTLTGERIFAPREELPSTFAAPGDPNAAMVLSFPTTLVRERRADGIYLHFRRVYKPREWNYIDYWSSTIVDEDVKKLGEKKPEELTHDERLTLIRSLAGVEAMKQVEFTQRALAEMDPNYKQDQFLAVRTAILEAYQEGMDSDDLVRKLETLSGEDREREVERAADRIMEQAHQACTQTLRTIAKFDDDKIARFQSALDKARRYYNITSQQAGHGFEIRVTMPGEVVAHNGDGIEDGEVEWEFDGNAFRDRAYELMVTSKLPLSREDRE